MNKIIILVPDGVRLPKKGEKIILQDGTLISAAHDSPEIKYSVFKTHEIEIPEWAIYYCSYFMSGRGKTSENINIPLNPPKKYRWKATIYGKEFTSELMTEVELFRWCEGQGTVFMPKSIWQKVEE
ncbi:MAG: hypothetical protein WC373_08515 [Smithella sp.]|jgi:hypothetical protein